MISEAELDDDERRPQRWTDPPGHRPAVHHAASPARTAHRITTPMLVLQSEADWRCPVEQGEQLFMALKRAGTIRR